MVMPGVVRTELTSGVGDTRGVEVLQPEDIADAVVEALQTGRYEVWCPRSLSLLYRTTRLLPLRWNDKIHQLTNVDKAILDSIDAPAWLDYQRRIEQAGGQWHLGAGGEE
jgi:short-subunit dehydrogenase